MAIEVVHMSHTETTMDTIHYDNGGGGGMERDQI